MTDAAGLEIDPERMTDAQWRDYVTARLRAGDVKFDQAQAALTANTSLVADVRREVLELKEKTQPIVEAMQTMEVGIRTIGRIGALGTALGKLVVLLAVAWVAGKFVFGGATWADVLATFRALGK